MPGTAHVGCSGWVYPDWRGVVYPRELPQRCWFEHYAARFDTVEINNTFYRLPTRSAVEGWAAQAPPGFVYAVKLGGFGSHRMKLRDAESWLPNHLDRVDRLGEHLGPNLVQLPPRWKRDVERLDEFLTVAPKRIRWAVELREPSWVHDDTFAVLARHGAALCIHDLLPSTPVGAHGRRLDLRPLPRPRRPGPPLPRPLHRPAAVAGRGAARRMARRRRRRLRLLQQRLARRRLRGRHLAGAAPRPPGAVGRGVGAAEGWLRWRRRPRKRSESRSSGGSSTSNSNGQPAR